MPDPQVIVVMNQFKASLRAKEQVQMFDMAQRWLDVERTLNAQINALALDFARRRSEGETISQRDLFAMTRYQSLLAQLQIELRNYTDYAERLIIDQQRQYAALGIQHAAQAINASITNAVGARFDILPIDATENMVGLAGDGSPLRQLLVDAWPDAANGLTQELIRSTALGINPRETARRMENGTTRTLNRMLTIARTEQLRVYRTASQMAYRESGVVSGYKRLATRDSRTCAGCLAADGDEYPTNEPFASHANCRCTLVPLVIGFAAPKPAETTEQWFTRQSTTTQRDILGPGRFDLWQSGAVAFKDFAAVRHSDVWGDSIVPATLGELANR